MFTPLNNAALKAQAKEKISYGGWKYLIIGTLILIFNQVFSNITATTYPQVGDEMVRYSYTTSFSSLFSLLVAPVVIVGATKYFLNFSNGTSFGTDDFKFAFDNYFKILCSMLWMELFEMLWSLLFIIPGIIKSVAYSFTPYILAENPNVGYKEAIKISMVLTDGRKGELFLLTLSFIGWFFLSALTFGIALIYVIPYYQTTMAQAYEQIKAETIAQGRVPQEVFMSEMYM